MKLLLTDRAEAARNGGEFLAVHLPLSGAMLCPAQEFALTFALAALRSCSEEVFGANPCIMSGRANRK
jgi:hypothetical protein